MRRLLTRSSGGLSTFEHLLSAGPSGDARGYGGRWARRYSHPAYPQPQKSQCSNLVFGDGAFLSFPQLEAGMLKLEVGSWHSHALVNGRIIEIGSFVTASCLPAKVLIDNSAKAAFLKSFLKLHSYDLFNSIIIVDHRLLSSFNWSKTSMKTCRELHLVFVLRRPRPSCLAPSSACSTSSVGCAGV